MAKNKHPKRKLAISMMTRVERANGTDPFQSKNWNNRVVMRRKKELGKMGIEYKTLIQKY